MNTTNTETARRNASFALLAAITTAHLPLILAAVDHVADLDCSSISASVAHDAAQWLDHAPSIAAPASKVERAWRELQSAAEAYAREVAV